MSYNCNSHFLGAKLRALRKRNGLTLEELSARCIQLDSHRAPSVSYLSMIESGKRVPSEDVLALLSSVFQREPRWFLDGTPDDAPVASGQRAGGVAGVPLEPAFLFSKELLQAAIPELLTQTGTTGRHFAHLLIRSHQEMSRNDFPDLERAAESVGERKFPLGADELMRLCRHHGLALRWFDRKPVLAMAINPCCIAATRGAPRTWREIPMCCRWGSTSHPRCARTASIRAMSSPASPRNVCATAAKPEFPKRPRMRSAERPGC